MFDGDQTHPRLTLDAPDPTPVVDREFAPPVVQGGTRNSHPVTGVRIDPKHVAIGARVFRAPSVAITLQDEQFGKFAGVENGDIVVLLVDGRAVYLTADTIVGHFANWPHSWDSPMVVINPTDEELAAARDASESPLLAALATSSFSEGES